jgi:biopolymer transport protein ExbD
MDIYRAPRTSKPIPLTPLIDVVFLLVVFFMVTTSFIKIESIELNLPTAEKMKDSTALASSDDAMLDSLIVVDMDKSGDVYVNQNPVDSHVLERILRKLIKDKTQKFLVRVGKEVSVQQLVEVMDVIHLAGGRDVAVSEWGGSVRLSAEERQRLEDEVTNPVIIGEQTAPATPASSGGAR